MWLLDTKTGTLNPARDSYAILSHVWSLAGEQSYQELCALHLHSGLAGASAKIRDCCAFADRHGYRKVWIDTCCIDKTSSAELSEAINSMFLWYSQAEICLVFLEDVSSGQDPHLPYSQFRRSKWFRRGWTLQELIASRNILFLSREWHVLGSKNSLANVISHITGIDHAILMHRRPLNTVSVAQRMSWASCRETTRLEDEAYCLMGIFDIHMPTLYGEGRRAFIRLQEEILRRIPDQSLFVWGSYPNDPQDLVSTEVSLSDPDVEENDGQLLLAHTPREFHDTCAVTTVPVEDLARELEQIPAEALVPESTITSLGVRTRLLLIPFKFGESLITHAAVLPCRDAEGSLLALLLRPTQGGPATNQYVVGNRRFLQNIRVTPLSALRSIGALESGPAAQEVYIPHMRSALPRPPLRPQPSFDDDLPGPPHPLNEHLKPIVCPCRIILPIRLHDDLQRQGYTVTLNGEPYTARLFDITAAQGDTVPSLGLKLAHIDGHILMSLYNPNRSAGGWGPLHAGISWHGAGEISSNPRMATSFRAGVFRRFNNESKTRTLLLAFDPWGQDMYALDIRITSLAKPPLASGTPEPMPVVRARSDASVETMSVGGPPYDDSGQNFATLASFGDEVN